MLQDSVRMKRPVPTEIQNAPKLKPELAFFIEAFFDLVGDRNNGFSQGVVPWTAMKAYADHYELDWETSEKLFFFIKRLDSVTMEKDSEQG